MESARGAPQSLAFDAERLDTLIKTLQEAGYVTIGPRADGAAIVYDEIGGAQDLPRGFGDEQEKGTYRLRRLSEPRYFGFNSSPESWKKVLHPSRVRLWRAKRENGRLIFSAEDATAKPLALIGVRACDLHAIRVQDRVREVSRLAPEDRRVPSKAFIVGVNCSQAAATCFCVSMSTGPELPDGPLGCDIDLTELYRPERHTFLATARTQEGAAILGKVAREEALESDKGAAKAQMDSVRASQVRSMPADGLSGFLKTVLQSKHWDDVASRCLSCANCTLVCPTCFCTTTDDVTDLTGDNAERWLRWDSCFTQDFSHLHGGSVRESTRSRYRQWLTHKLGTWQDQFGSSGCVGCGRCIAWCPVGIDLTEEVRALKAEAEKDPPRSSS